MSGRSSAASALDDQARFGDECRDSKTDSVYKFGPDGKVVKSFGGGMFIWPHGLDVDPDGNVWVTDAVAANRTPKGDKRGHHVVKFSPDGKVLMTLGTPGVAGSGPDHFNSPSDVVVAPNGDVFVADGHGENGNNRDREVLEGRQVRQGVGQDRLGARASSARIHAIAMDSRGRVFVGDRGNNRIQIFDQDGKSLDAVDAVRQAERHLLRQQGSDLRRRLGVRRRAESRAGRWASGSATRRPAG